MPQSIDLAAKARLVATLRKTLSDEMERTTQSQQSVQKGSTHTEAKQESDKDTRAIEAGYLARGLSMRVEALGADLARLDMLKLRAFGEDEPAVLGAWLVTEDLEGAAGHYFLAPVGGGIRMPAEGVMVTIVTPKSPVGRALVSRTVGDDVSFVTPGGTRVAEVVSVF